MAKIILEIEKCTICPYYRAQHTNSGIQHNNWECSEAQGRKSFYEQLHSEVAGGSLYKNGVYVGDPYVPDWCPLLLKEDV